MQSSRYYCFTLNNPEYQDTELIEKFYEDQKAVFIIFQKEHSTTTHLQGYVQLVRAQKLGYMKKHFSTKAHFEISKGTPQQNIDYCSKEDTQVQSPIIYGTPKLLQPGQRTDMIKLALMIKNGCTNLQLFDAYPGHCLRMQKHITGLRSWLIEDTTKPIPKIKIYYGKTGTGKTRTIHQDHEAKDIWSYSGHTGALWFDGYRGQKVAVFDEFYGQIPFSILLKITDRYKLSLPIKGGFVNFIPEYIYFTSNQTIDNWYPFKDISPLRRRIDSIQKFDTIKGVSFSVERKQPELVSIAIRPDESQTKIKGQVSITLPTSDATRKGKN